jgi:hypothetical protein
METIREPGDRTSLIWLECLRGRASFVVGWLTLTVTSPGSIEILRSVREGVVSILDCDTVAPALSEAMIALKAGAGGVAGDDPALLASRKHRRWYVKPDSTGDLATLDETLRHALPGDTVLVAGGTYHENIILRRGVVVLGSWDYEFTGRSLSMTPSIIDAGKHHIEAEEHHTDEGEHHTHPVRPLTVVEGSLGLDSTTVLDGFVLTGGTSKQGGGITLRNGAKPVLSNLIIHSNTASYGGGIFCNSSSPTISNCLIAGNEGDLGGGVYCTSGSSPIITNTTIVGNRAPVGAAVAAAAGSFPAIERSIIADHPDPSSIYTQDRESGIAVSCCDLWQNETPQYGGVTGEGAELRGNISEDPQFTNPSGMDFTPKAGSPVLSVPDCGSIGPECARIPG